MILIEKSYILTPLQKLLQNDRDLGKLIVAKGFKKLPNLVTLMTYALLLKTIFHFQIRTSPQVFL